MKTRPNATFTGLLMGLVATGFAMAADLKVPSDYATIQAAVDAANTDDTIRIAPGVYAEQVQIISKSLTLIGQPGAILRATGQLALFPGFVVDQFPIMGIRSSQITVRGLTFEGERLAGHFIGPAALHAIFFRESSLNVENCSFYGFRESTAGFENAEVITGVNFEHDAVNVRVVGCTFADNYRGVFFVGSPTNQSINVTIENNTFIGPGPLGSAFSHTGIAIREGVGGRITGNTISGYSYVGTGADFPISFGILADNEANYPDFGVRPPLVIEGNAFQDNQMHVALIKGDGSIVRNNRLKGSAPGIIPLGLAVSGTNVTIAGNQFEDMPEGIRLLGNDPMFGTILGAAVNARVISNRFCDVTVPINRQPLATATELGTSRCPFPPVALNITPAVLLSWPVIEEGYVVETAPVLDGQWSPSNATPFLQNGQRSIAVPANDENRFFRLRKL